MTTLADDVDIEVETDRLFAVLDGLAIHAAMRPAQATAGKLRAVLAHHLDTLTSTGT